MSDGLISDLAVDLTKITRFELIDWSESGVGRAWVGGQPYDKLPITIQASIQDGGRTLKIFVQRTK